MYTVSVKNEVEGFSEGRFKFHDFGVKWIGGSKLVLVFLKKDLVQLANSVGYSLDTDFFRQVVAKLRLRGVGIYILNQLVDIEVCDIRVQILPALSLLLG